MEACADISCWAEFIHRLGKNFNEIFVRLGEGLR
jgi:hypothetical protein